jgi:hypothetical protein
MTKKIPCRVPSWIAALNKRGMITDDERNQIDGLIKSHKKLEDEKINLEKSLKKIKKDIEKLLK